MTLLSAEAVDAQALREAFNAAFADYLIGPMTVAAEGWPVLLARQGVQLAASRVVTDGTGQVLAFALVAPLKERAGRSRASMSPAGGGLGSADPGGLIRHRTRLATMGARPDARGAGHAPRLLDTVIGEARARVDRTIELEVFARNARSLALYSSRVFEPVAELHV